MFIVFRTLHIPLWVRCMTKIHVMGPDDEVQPVKPNPSLASKAKQFALDVVGQTLTQALAGALLNGIEARVNKPGSSWTSEVRDDRVYLEVDGETVKSARVG